MNEMKIRNLSKGTRYSLSVSAKKELEKFATDENYVCSSSFKSFLVDHGYADKNDIVDRPYIERLLKLTA